MYAVIESGGKQYRVSVGERLKVESLKLDAGSTLNLDKVLFLADGDAIEVGTPYVGSHVVAKVVGHGRGEKIRILKLRRRKNSRQRAGHRQNFTELEIVSIDGKSKVPTAKPAKKAVPSKGSGTDPKATATKTTARKKTKASVKKVAKTSKKTVASGAGKKKKTTKKVAKKTSKKTSKKG